MFLKTNLLILLFSLTAFGQGRQVGKFDVIESHGTPKNHIKNPYARNNTLGTSTSNATIARDTDAADKLDGLSSFVCDSSATDGYCAWQTMIIPEGDKTGNCQASFMFKGDASLYSLRITDTTNTLTDLALTNASDWTEAGPVIFPCGENRDVRLVQTTAGTGAAVNVGRVKWEKANIGTVAQAEARIHAYRASSAQSIGSNSYTKVQLNAELYDYYGEYDSSTNYRFTPKKPGVVKFTASLLLSFLTSGERYQIQVVRNGDTGSSTGFICFGTAAASASGSTAVRCSGTAVITNSTDYFEVLVKSDADTSYEVSASQSASIFTAEYFPTSSELAIRPTDAAWYVDANIAGGNPNLGVSNVASYTEITDGSLTLTPASGSAPVGIMCSGTNAAATPSTSPTTCSAGSESVGFNVAVPQAGVYEVCAYFAHRSTADSGETIATTFQLVETATNAQTILTEGRTRIGTFQTAETISGGANARVGSAISNCSVFNFSSAGTKGLRLMYEQEIAGSPNDSFIFADAAASVGQRDIRITMRPWLGKSNAPLLVGSVTSNSQGLLRFEAARVTCAASATVDSNTSSWLSIGNLSGGNCALTFTAPFSATPWCVTQSINGTATTIIQPKLTSVSSSGATLTSAQVSSGSSTIASASSTIADIFCIGTK